MPHAQRLELGSDILEKIPTRLFDYRQEFFRMPIHSLTQRRLQRYLIYIQCQLKEKVAIDTVDCFKILLDDAQ